MMIIDSQVHAYERNHPGRPWAGFLTGPDEVTGDAMVAAMEAVGVAGAVLVSPFSLYGYDASYALEVSTQHPGRFGLVKPVNPTDPAVAETIADWALRRARLVYGSCCNAMPLLIPPILASIACWPRRRSTTCR
jgi:L-fuconolactonase